MSKDDKPWLIKPGQTLNPGGRPVGSRNKLQGDFLRELSADFDKYGRSAIMRAREEDPMGYIRVIAGILPKEMEFKRPLEDMSEDEIIALIALIKQQQAAGAERTIDAPQDQPKRLQ